MKKFAGIFMAATLAMASTVNLYADDFTKNNIFANMSGISNEEVSLLDSETVTMASSESDFEFNRQTGTITKYIGSGGDVVIPSSINGVEVKAIGDETFAYCSSLSNITIPNSVSSIGNGTFNNCYSLSNITIPNSVSSIGDYAFSYCSSLSSSITIPAAVSSIGYKAFIGCSSLPGINVDNGNMAYSSINGVLFNKNKTELIACPSNLKGSYAIPNTVSSIGDYAFFNSSLTDITIPNTVSSIGEDAFSGCHSLTGITIPNSVSSIGHRAFSNCSSLPGINVDNGNMVYSSIDGILFNKNKTEIISYPAGLKGSYAIPNTVSSIGDYAFYLCFSLTDITIPDTVSSIGAYAFADCSSLSNITIPDTVSSIGDHAFDNCSSLSNITIPNSVSSIGDYAFSSCTLLTDITIPDTVSSIGDWAFSGCCSLTGITIPGSVSSIGDFAFFSCTLLTDITIPDTVSSIGDYAFRACNNLTVYCYKDSAAEYYAQINNIPYKYIIHDVEDNPKVFEIENGKLYYTDKGIITKVEGSMTAIVIPDEIDGIKITAIGDKAFSSCTELKDITLPAGINSIKANAVNPNVTIHYKGETIYDIDGDGKLTGNDAAALMQIVLGKTLSEAEPF